MCSPFQVTVHNYVSEQGPTPSYSTNAILDHGRNLIHASCSNLGWRTPVSFDESLFELRRDRLYNFSTSPPRVRAHRTQSRVLEDWGELPSPGDDEAFVLDALEEFAHIPFEVPRPARKRSASSASCTGTQPRNIARHNTASPNGLTLEPLPKRRRYDVACISHLIPQPHFVAGPSVDFPPLDTQNLKPYRKGRALPIPPSDVSSVQLFMECCYNRAAWLIPVRGSLPWEGATCAVVLESSEATNMADVPLLPSGPLPNDDGISRITWTHHSLVAFWKFLISIQQAKNLGPISLSFHTAPSDTTFTPDSATDPTAESGNRPVQPARLKLSAEFSDDFSDEVRRVRLEATDFIKVYHDVKYSLYLRNVLDAYQYIPESIVTNSHDTAVSITKIRLLKGARLTLIDNLSKPAFMI